MADALGPILAPLFQHLATGPGEPLPELVRLRLQGALERAEAGESLSRCLGIGAEPKRDAAILRASQILGGDPWQSARRIADALAERERTRKPPAESELQAALAAIASARRPIRTPEGIYKILSNCRC